MTAKLELLAGPAAHRALSDAGATTYRYELNRAGLTMALGLAAVFYAGGGLCYWQTRLAEPGWTVVFVALMFAGVGLTALAAYWHQFANQQLVGVSDSRLFVGNEKALWAIAWDLLDRRTMGFENLQMTRLRGALQMRVAGQEIRLHLFNVFAYIADLEGLMHGVLSHLTIEPEPQPDADSEE